MKKLVLGICSSPRNNSNSEILLNHILKGAGISGHSTEKINLSQSQISPCHACLKCKNSEAIKCALEDDMQEIIEKLIKADCIIFASPIYFFSVSAQMKIFIDRLYCLVDENKKQKMAGKDAVIILTHGHPSSEKSGALIAMAMFKKILNFFEISLIHKMLYSCQMPGEILEQPDILQKAVSIGESL
ncbi:MAG: hypothetical protein APR63_12075 [Desulfuromonas sp. SDB]|nr:MAG: hypothetical protein APR63_12075 [Desulfuromonas sp. SDB]